jgi:uncharacterized membrane protein
MPEPPASPRAGCVPGILGAIIGAVLAPIALIAVLLVLIAFQAWYCDACLEGAAAILYIFILVSPIPGALIGVLAGIVWATGGIAR